MAGRGTHKEWFFLSFDRFLQRFGALLGGIPHLGGFNVLPPIIGKIVWDNPSSFAAPDPRAGHKKSWLMRGLQVLQDPIATEGVERIGEPMPFLIPVSKLKGGGQFGSREYAQLRRMVEYHVSELFHMFRDAGMGAETSKDEIAKLFYDYKLEPAPVSIERAIQNTRESFNEISDIPYEEFRARGSAETTKQNLFAEQNKKLLERIIAVKMRHISRLAMAMERAKSLSKGINDLCTNNIKDGKQPTRSRFIKSIFGPGYKDIELKDALIIALFGQVNPAVIWPALGFLNDFFELAIFLGNRAFKRNVAPSSACANTYVLDVSGPGLSKACVADAIPRRELCRNVLRKFISDHMSNDVLSELRAAANLP